MLPVEPALSQLPNSLVPDGTLKKKGGGGGTLNRKGSGSSKDSALLKPLDEEKGEA